jgi:hypothetical protein
MAEADFERSFLTHSNLRTRVILQLTAFGTEYPSCQPLPSERICGAVEGLLWHIFLRQITELMAMTSTESLRPTLSGACGYSPVNGE